MIANSNLLFLCQDKIGTALAQPVATGRLDRVLQEKVTLRTAVLLPGVRLEDSSVDFVPRHLAVTRIRARKDNWTSCSYANSRVKITGLSVKQTVRFANNRPALSAVCS